MPKNGRNDKNDRKKREPLLPARGRSRGGTKRQAQQPGPIARKAATEENYTSEAAIAVSGIEGSFEIIEW